MQPRLWPILILCGLLSLLWPAGVAAQTYSNTDAGAINGTLACSGTARLTRTFTVQNLGTVTDVDLGFLASHTWRGDIRLELSHNGVSQILLEDDITNAGIADNWNIRLDDQANPANNAGNIDGNHSTTATPFQFERAPDNPLSVFNGLDAAGNWTISICDNFPTGDNGQFLRADLIITATPPPPPPPLSCNVPLISLDWDSNAWPNGALTQSYTLGTVPVTYTVSGDTNRLTADPQGSGALPVTSDYTTGGTSPPEQALQLRTDFVSNTESVTITIDLGQPGFGVQAMTFWAFDVDSDGTGFQDEIEITGSLGGIAVTPNLTAGLNNQVTGNVASGFILSDNASADGNVRFTFDSPIDQLQLTYRSGPNAPADPSAQAMGFHDLSICPRAEPELIASKDLQIYDPLGEGLYAVPGNDVIYTISITNSGDGPADNDSIIVIDKMPPELSFYNGDLDDSGPATAPIALVAQNSPGLSLSYPADVGFSNGTTKPASFSDCSYAPASGYDPNVTFICVNPKGAFAAGDPDPAIAIQFRARIN